LSKIDFDKVKKRLEELLVDEESEVRHYVDLAQRASDPKIRAALKSIAEDTIVHYYVVKALLESIREIEMFRRRLTEKQGEYRLEEIATNLVGHDKLESLIEVAYTDLIDIVDIGSTRAILKVISEEEKKHSKLVKLILEMAGYKRGKK